MPEQIVTTSSGRSLTAWLGVKFLLACTPCIVPFLTALVLPFKLTTTTQLRQAGQGKGFSKFSYDVDIPQICQSHRLGGKRQRTDTHTKRKTAILTSLANEKANYPLLWTQFWGKALLSVHRLSLALLIENSARNTGCPLFFCARVSCAVFHREFESEATSPTCHPISLAHLSPPSCTALDRVRTKVVRLGDVSTTGIRAHNGPFPQT